MSSSESKDLDVSCANRGVWLVKVPKYISNRWNKVRDTEVGRLRINKSSKLDVVFTLSDSVINAPIDVGPSVGGSKSANAVPATDDKSVNIPKEYQFTVTAASDQSLAVFSQCGDNKVGMEGHVIQKAECKPMKNDRMYMQFQKHSILRASHPVRQVKQLDHVVNTYKPVSDHKNNIEFEQQKKAEGKKSREDKDKVNEMLFAAFEKHQYYNIKDLVRITKQPITYLKEILKEICNYNLKNPHKNMWELKPEYRHYKAPENE